MHELGLMEEVVTAVLRGVPDGRITQVRLEVGQLSAVVPDALRFCFEVCTRDTRLQGARLEIQAIPGNGQCSACGRERLVTELPALCDCGEPLVHVTGGRMVRVTQVEVQ